MNEIIYPIPTILEICGRLSILIAVLILIFILEIVLKKRIKGSSKKQIRIVLIIVNCCLFLFMGLIGDILLIFDIAFNNKTEIQEMMVEVNEFNAGYNIYYKNTKVSIPKDSQIANSLEDFFVGHLCETEYYKLSKYVTRITLLE